MKNSSNDYSNNMWTTFVTPIYTFIKLIDIIIPIIALSFFITFTYNFLKAAKTAFVLSDSEASAFAIPFLKMFAILPLAFINSWALSKISRFIKIETIFMSLLLLYTLFFVWFSFVSLHPEYYILNNLIPKAENILPEILFRVIKPGLALIKIWPITIFYCFSEMWHVSVFFFGFCGFLNAHLSPLEGTIIYSVVNISGNISGIFIPSIITITKQYFPNTTDRYWMYSIIQICTIAMIATWFMILRYVIYRRKRSSSYKDMQKSRPYNDMSSDKHSSMQLSFYQAMQLLVQSSYARGLVLTTILYQSVVNIVETIWNMQIVTASQHDPGTIEEILSGVIKYTSILSLTISILLPWLMSKNLFYVTTVSLPASVYVLLTILFALTYISYKQTHSNLIPDADLLTWLCSTIIIWMRSCKYSIFDTMKELCLLVLDRERLELKLLVDTFASRLGKTTGSAITLSTSLLALMMFGGTPGATILMISLIGQILSGWWIFITKSVSSEYLCLLNKQESAETTNSLEEHHKADTP